MDKRFFTAGLICLLFLNGICAATFAILYVRGMRDIRQLQSQAASINTIRRRGQAVLNEAMEYSKRNPGIDPILQAVGAKPRPAAAAPPSKPGK